MPPVDFSALRRIGCSAAQYRSERLATVFLGEVQQHSAVDIARADLFQIFQALRIQLRPPSTNRRNRASEAADPVVAAERLDERQEGSEVLDAIFTLPYRQHSSRFGP
jgi:hypothetical protein